MKYYHSDGNAAIIWDEVVSLKQCFPESTAKQEKNTGIFMSYRSELSSVLSSSPFALRDA